MGREGRRGVGRSGGRRAIVGLVAGPIGLIGAMALAAGFAGCGSAANESTTRGSTLDVPGGGNGSGGGSGTTIGGGGANGGGANGAGGAAAAAGVPCDVADVLAKQCLSCHGHPLSGGATVSLVTYDELTAKSPIDGTMEVARSVIRMQAGTMPPGGGGTGADVLQGWVNGGVAKGTCGGAGGSGQTTTSTTDTNTNTNAAGVPCDVADVFGKHCFSCHGHPLANGVTLPLVTYDELAADSPTYPGTSVAARAVARMQKGDMPPAGKETPASPAEIAAVQAWIASSMPKGDCGTDAGASIDAGPDPFAGPAVCSSGKHWGGIENDRMAPGQACTACHQKEGEGPIFSIAGTVFPTAHEPDDCIASESQGATVEITGKNGKKISLTVNSAGNFFYEGYVALPYTARVITANGVREMFKEQTNGDCNTCHTQNGANGALGRILLP